MKTNKIVRLIFLGFVVWLVPFVISLGFFDKSGKLTIGYDLFKSIMIVISTVVGCYALIRYFKTISGNFRREAWLAGLTWLAINLILDLVILIPVAKMSYTEYFSSIGLRYLQIPIICLAAGVMLDRRALIKT